MPKSKTRKSKNSKPSPKRTKKQQQIMMTEFDDELKLSINYMQQLLDHIDKMDNTVKTKAEQFDLLDIYNEQYSAYKAPRDMIQFELDKLEEKRKELKTIQDLTEAIAILPKSFSHINNCIEEAQKSMVETTQRLDNLSHEEKDD